MTKNTHIALAVFICVIIGSVTSLQAASLAGSWKGSGRVTSNAGLQERVRCNVNISKNSEKSFSMNAYCATTSGKVNQSASLRKTGSNTFKGSFYNAEKKTRGTVRITLRGNRYTMRMSSSRGSANVSMRRR